MLTSARFHNDPDKQIAAAALLLLSFSVPTRSALRLQLLQLTSDKYILIIAS